MIILTLLLAGLEQVQSSTPGAGFLQRENILVSYNTASSFVADWPPTYTCFRRFSPFCNVLGPLLRFTLSTNFFKSSPPRSSCSIWGLRRPSGITSTASFLLFVRSSNSADMPFVFLYLEGGHMDQKVLQVPCSTHKGLLGSMANV